MTRGEIWKDFFKKTVLTVLIAGVLLYSQRTGQRTTFMCGCAAVFPLVFAVCSYGLYRMGMT